MLLGFQLNVAKSKYGKYFLFKELFLAKIIYYHNADESEKMIWMLSIIWTVLNESF